MNAQEYIIILIGVVALIIAGRKIMALFAKKSSPCDGCSGCELTAQNKHECK